MSLKERKEASKQGGAQKDRVSLLTPRELQVLRLIVEGKSNKEIGWALKITIDTVKLHVTHILQKLEVTGRTQAAVVYVKSNWNNRGHNDLASGEETDKPEGETKGA